MDLAGQSTEKLRSNGRKLQNLLITFAVLGLISVITLCVLRAKLVLFIPVLVLPITFLPMVLSLQSIKAELKSRSNEL